MNAKDPVVWSSEPRRPDSGPAADSAAPASPARPEKPSSSAPPARVRIERQGRGGKVVTVVDGLPGHPARIEEIAKTLKSRCGAGGTVKGRVVEIQGDHRDRVIEALATLGVAAKRAGG